MPKTSTHKYLKLHHNKWVFRFAWPKDVQKYVRETEFIRSTGTTNLHEALIKRDVFEAECKKALYYFRSDDEKVREQELLDFRKKWSKAPVIEDEKGFVSKEADDLEEEIFARAVDIHVEGGMDELLKEHKKDAAAPSYNDALSRLGKLKSVNDYIRLASNQKELSTTLVHYLNEWVSWRKNDVIPKTVDDGKSVVLKFAKDFPTLNDVNHHDVGRWFEKLRIGAGTKKLGSKRRRTIKSHLVSYWKFLQRNLEMPVVPRDVNPFSDIEFPSLKNRKQGVMHESWKHFPDMTEDVVRIMNALQEKEDRDLWILCFISMFTGMRPEEIAQSKKHEIHIGRSDRSYIHIPRENTKSDAGLRDVPIHSELLPLIKELTYWYPDEQREARERFDKEHKIGKFHPDANEYLIEGIVSNSKYGIRSDPLSQRFKNLKNKLGYNGATVLYSFRKTVITMLHQADVSDGLVPYIVGHEPPSFTFSVYSGGPSMKQKRDAIEKIQYRDGSGHLIRWHTGWWHVFDDKHDADLTPLEEAISASKS